MRSHLHLVLGGSRSGKSRRAEALAATSGLPVVYVATCATSHLDDEMRNRIAQHRARRPPQWITVENRFDLGGLIGEFSTRLILVDCLTLWLSFRMAQVSINEVILELSQSLKEIERASARVILVSDELGLGLVPLGAENRAFRDLCGQANQVAAENANRVEMMVAGIPLLVKGEL